MFHEFELILWSCHSASPKLKQFVGNVATAKQMSANLKTSDVIFERVQTHLLQPSISSPGRWLYAKMQVFILLLKAHIKQFEIGCCC